ADAITGQPVPKATVDFFGWQQVQVAPNKNEYKVVSTSFKETTDADGQLMLGQNKIPQNYQWLIVARKDKAGLAGADRFAYLGFTYQWFGRIYDQEYNQTKVFAITDRPVYRPNQTVQFKFWVRHAKYDEPDVSTFANQPFTIRITNPKGEKVLES